MPQPLSPHSQRGAASLEALMVVVFLVMLWSGLNYLGKAHIVVQSERAKARGCAFYVATNNCTGIPDFCQVNTQNSASEPEGTDKLTRTFDDGEDSKYQDATQDTLESEVKNGLFQRAETSSSAEIDRPAALGGGTRDLSQTFNLPCNPKPGNLLEKALDLFQQLMNKERDDMESEPGEDSQ